MTKILIAESLDQQILNEFKQNTRIEFIYKPEISVTELEGEISIYDGLIVRPKIVSEKIIANATNLKLIIRGGAGVNSIAIAKCAEMGIFVENAPGLNSDATAEYTISLMMRAFCNRQIAESSLATRSGNPGLPENYSGFELHGKKLGLVGLGNIGSRVAKIAKAFGMEVVAYVRKEKDSPAQQLNSLYKLLISGCDIISLHIPLDNSTLGIIGEKELSLMKRGTCLINTARPQLIDSLAFAKALENGQISSFGIDGDYELVVPFINADPMRKGIITHHIADSTFEAQRNITKQVLTQAVAFFEHGELINRVG